MFIGGRLPILSPGLLNESLRLRAISSKVDRNIQIEMSSFRQIIFGSKEMKHFIPEIAIHTGR